MRDLVPFLQLKNVKNTHKGVIPLVKPATLLKVSPHDGCFFQVFQSVHMVLISEMYHILNFIISVLKRSVKLSLFGGGSMLMKSSNR